MTRHSTIAILTGAVLALTACGDDDGGATDGGNADAALDGGGNADAFSPCPGQNTFEAEVKDLNNGAVLPGVTVTDAANMSSNNVSAPNGRILVCLDAGADYQLDHTSSLHVPMSMFIGETDVAGFFASPQSIVSELTSAANWDTVLAPLAATYDNTTAQLLVYARALPSGDPIVGAQVTVDATNAGTLVRNGGTFEAGDTTIDDALVLFGNVMGAAANVTVTANGLTCAGPGPVPLVAGESATAVFVCR